ncbi:hypothetical protein Tco_0077370 [Tanacetum coccineum]
MRTRFISLHGRLMEQVVLGPPPVGGGGLSVPDLAGLWRGVKPTSLDGLSCGVDLYEKAPRKSACLIENMTAHHNDWDTSAQRNESSSSITSFNPEIAALKLQMEEMNRNLTKMLQTNQQVNAVNTEVATTCGGLILPMD